MTVCQRNDWQRDGDRLASVFITRLLAARRSDAVRRQGHLLLESRECLTTIQYNIRLLEAVRTQRRTIIEREKYVENENVKMVHNE